MGGDTRSPGPDCSASDRRKTHLHPARRHQRGLQHQLPQHRQGVAQGHTPGEHRRTLERTSARTRRPAPERAERILRAERPAGNL